MRKLTSRVLLLSCVAFLAACESPTESSVAPASSNVSQKRVASSERMNSSSFMAVARSVEPVAERECRRRAPNANCDYLICIDPNKNAPVNAYQSLDKNGRPVITFTQKMIATSQNRHELAFVLGHEAAHHIRGHLGRQAQNAAAGAIIFVGLAALTGGSAADIQAAQQIGEVVGARSYSKNHELEADQLGTVIAYAAGYDPVIGAQNFTRIPDPGNKFLGSHPPNAQRIEIVRRTAAQLQSGG